MLTLYGFGDLRLERDGAPVLQGRRKPLALLMWLHRRRSAPASRDEIAEMFWGDSGEANAKKSLRQCLSELRVVLGDAMIETAGGVLVAPDSIESDVLRFESACAAGHWETAVDFWKGELIPDGEALGTEAWRAWLDGDRVALRRRLGVAWHHLTEMAEERGAWVDVIRAAARWRTLLPQEARAWVREIHALQSAGRLTEALARHADAEHHFRDTLEVPVPDEIARLGRALARLRETGESGAHLLTPDLVARGELLSLLGQVRQQSRAPLATRGRSLTLLAMEGMGKSRVLREFARQSRDRGDTVIDVAALTIDRDRSLALCRTILARITSHSALAGCAPESLAALAHVAPELRETFRHLPVVAAPDLRSFTEAFNTAVAELASTGNMILAIDDLAEADRDSIAVLVTVMQRVPAGLLVIVTGRPDSWRAHRELVDLQDRTDPVDKVTLAPLDRNEVRAMLSSLAPIAASDLDSASAEWHHLSGGIPGMLVSLISDAVVQGKLLRHETGEWRLHVPPTASPHVPSDIEERWRARYGQLDMPARAAVDALAVLASSAPEAPVDVTEWERMSGLATSEFRPAVEATAVAGITVLSGRVVRFGCELHRILAYDSLGSRLREGLHARSARALRGWRVSRERRAVVAYHRRASGGEGRRRRLSLFAGAGALLLAAGGWFATGRADRVSSPTSVVMIDVENLTGDSLFDRTIQLAASVALQQSRTVSVFPRARVQETFRLMQKAGADSQFDEVLGREVAIRENLSRVLALAIARVDSEYVLTARIIEPHSGRDLFAATERAMSKGAVLVALDRVMVRVRRAAGEPADSLRQYALPLPRVTTASLPALQSYAAGLQYFRRGEYDGALAAYLRAVEIDSSFALAWGALADLYIQVARNRPAGDSALARALALTERLSERERLRLELVSAFARGSVDDGVRLAGRLAQRFPDRDTWYNYGTSLMQARRCQEAIPALERSLAFDSAFATAHINAATCHQFLGNYAASIRSYNRVHAADSTALYRGSINHEFGIALVRAGLVDSARRVHVRMTERLEPSDRQFGHRSLGYLAAYGGRYREASAHFDTAARLARVARTTLSEFRNRLLQSQHLLSAGDVRAANEFLDSTWAAGMRQPLVPYFALGAGIAYTRAGQLGRAAAMLDSISRIARAESPSEQSDRAILAAHVALHRGDARGARAVLKQATDTTRSDFVLAVLAEAYEALGHKDSTYETLSRLAARTPYGTDGQEAWFRALIRRAALAEQLELPDEARAGYDRLLMLWANADDDLPLLAQIKRGATRMAVTDAAPSRSVLPKRPRE